MVTLNSPKVLKIGVIAEDASDVEVVSALIAKYIPDSDWTIRKFVGNGCGRLRHKCRAWSCNLMQSGCQHLLILHDLDRQDERRLRETLLKQVPKKDFPKAAIVIPVEELEAWLLADEVAISTVFSFKKEMKRVRDPESIPSPKEHLGDLVWREAKKRYLHTKHNHRIAAAAKIECLQRCKSFSEFDRFVRGCLADND